VRGGRAIADRLAHDHRAEAVLHGIDRRRAHAAAGGAAGDDQRIDPAVFDVDDKRSKSN
jgi:hypothetical protein